MMKKWLPHALTLVALVLFVVLGLGSGASTPKAVDTVISFDPSTMRNVKRISDDGIDKGWLAVSRDGQKLLYCERPVEWDLTGNNKNLSSRILYLRNASIFAKTPLVESFSYGPAFYENGTNFVYVQRNEDGNTQLIKGSLTGGAKTFVTRNPIGSGDDNPSIRQGIIACDTYINGRRQIVTVRDNGSELTILGPGYNPSWHPTENKLLFNRDSGIWEMDTETTQVSQLYVPSKKDVDDGLYATGGSYSADGSYIIFLRRVKVGRGTYRHLFKMNPDGSNLTELTTGEIDVWAPVCGAGNEVFFISKAGGKTHEIWSALINVD